MKIEVETIVRAASPLHSLLVSSFLLFPPSLSLTLLRSSFVTFLFLLILSFSSFPCRIFFYSQCLPLAVFFFSKPLSLCVSLSS